MSLTYQQFVDRFGVRMRATPVDRNPNMDQDDWHASASHWRCTFTRRDADNRPHQMRVYFSQGSAHTKPPTAAEVIACLAMDAAGYHNARDFADWCAEYGYDPDSRRAERTYRQVERQYIRLEQFCGSLAAFETLMFHTSEDGDEDTEDAGTGPAEGDR